MAIKFLFFFRRNPFVSNSVLNPRNDFLQFKEKEKEMRNKKERQDNRSCTPLNLSESLEHFNIPHQTWITKIPPILLYSNNDIHSREK